MTIDIFSKDIYSSYHYFYIHTKITHSLEECFFVNLVVSAYEKHMMTFTCEKTGSMLHPARGYKS